MSMAISSTKRRIAWIGAPIVLILLFGAFWNWDWLIPVVQSRASAALGRPVTIAHLHVRLGRVTTVVADGVLVANPPDWQSSDPPFAALRTLTIQVDAWGYIQGHGLVLPMIGIEGPQILAAETADGTANYQLSTSSGGDGGTSVKIGDIRIVDGDARILIPRLKADFNLKIATQGDGDATKIVVDAKGTYSAQPITGHLVGGALLSLRDAEHPWPIDLTVANGATHVALAGTIQDPLAFRGADLRLELKGPDMSLLEGLVGFPIPTTPAYNIAGKLNLQGFQKIRFENFQGRMGKSDIAGTIEEQLNGTENKGRSKPVVTMDLRSNRVDLKDLSGFIGGTPGQANTGNATPRDKTAGAKANAPSRFLPDAPISVPRLDWADIHLRYHGTHIEGRNIPLDDLTVIMDVVGGNITVHPISSGVGTGQLSANIDLSPRTDKTVHVRMDLRMQNLDLSRIMEATHTFEGAGSVSGVGALDGTGDSFASLLANGNGQLKMAMAGGNLSAVLVDLTGLHFGKALLSALGIPSQTPIECFVGDLEMKRGVLDFKILTLDTGEAIVNVGGNVDLGKETIDLALRTDAKHFSVGSLPTRLDITGTFEKPSILPGTEAAARAGAVAGLAALFAPLAILPTVQFGTSEADDARCTALLQQARASAAGKAVPPQQPKAGPAR